MTEGGHHIDAAARRELLGAPVPPVWYVLRVVAQQEGRASAWLREAGVGEPWYPTDKIHVRARGGQRRKRPRYRPAAPGYVLLRAAHDVRWDRLIAAAPSYLYAVITQDGAPLPVSDETVADMAQVPERLETLRRRRLDLARRRRAADPPRPGERAQVGEGDMTGWTLDVSRIDGGLAECVAPMGGARMRLPLHALERTTTDGGTDD